MFEESVEGILMMWSTEENMYYFGLILWQQATNQFEDCVTIDDNLWDSNVWPHEM